MTGHDPTVRGLAPPLYGFLYAPLGLATGFVTVTLGYLLAHSGVSVAAVGGLVGLFLLPQTLKFVTGPLVDASLTPRTWSAICIVAGLAAYVAVASLWRPAGAPAPRLAPAV